MTSLIKKKRWYFVGGLFALVLTIVLVACGSSSTSIPTSLPTFSPISLPTPTPTSSPIPITTPTPTPDSSHEPPNTFFFHETEMGRTILNYLSCLDFDCPEAMSAVVALGSDATVALLQILRNGVPSDVAAELPGDVSTMVGLKAIAALGELGDPRALDSLAHFGRNPNPLLRAETATALGQFKSEDTALGALLLLLNDKNSFVRETTAKAITNLGDLGAIPELCKALETEPEEYIRKEIEIAIQTLEGR